MNSNFSSLCCRNNSNDTEPIHEALPSPLPFVNENFNFDELTAPIGRRNDTVVVVEEETTEEELQLPFLEDTIDDLLQDYYDHYDHGGEKNDLNDTCPSSRCKCVCDDDDGFL